MERERKHLRVDWAKSFQSRVVCYCVCAPISLSLKVASLRILTPCVPFYFNGVYFPPTPKALTCRPIDRCQYPLAFVGIYITPQQWVPLSRVLIHRRSSSRTLLNWLAVSISRRYTRMINREEHEKRERAKFSFSLCGGGAKQKKSCYLWLEHTRVRAARRKWTTLDRPSFYFFPAGHQPLLSRLHIISQVRPQSIAKSK